MAKPGRLMGTLSDQNLDTVHDEPLTLEALLRLGRNRDVFRLLGEQLASRIGVVPFVGAGLSIPSGMPGWANFLREEACAMGTECVTTIEAYIRCGEFEEAAEYLAQHQGLKWFEDTLVYCLTLLVL
jgi:hypothetical protein